MAARKTKPDSTPAAPPPLRLEWRSPAELAENPANWRRHPANQIAALTDAVAEVGWAGACLYNERTGRLIDGHARRKVALEQGAEKVPVLVGDWTEAQEAKILATLDPLAAMAEVDGAALDALLRDVQTGSEALGAMLTGLAEAAGATPAAGESRLKQLDVRPPPKMSWVLVGISTVRFGEIAAEVERIGAVPGIVCETTVNDGPDEKD